MDSDATWMARALELARRGEDGAEPNPLVGAVLVKDGAVVGEGWHALFGGPHAEVAAFRAAGDRAHGSTLYVNLEPCAHQGKTPPCVPAVISAGVARVVAAMADPFPAVNGRGIDLLRAAGIEVSVGVGAAEARHLNAPFLKFVTTRVPWVIAKWAMTLDGKIATRTGDSKWITGEEARRLARRWRQSCGAVVVGAATVLQDDPELLGDDATRPHPLRVVLDTYARTRPGSKLVKSAREVPVLIAHVRAAPASRLAALEAAGCRLLALDERDGRPDVTRLLAHLGAQGIPRVYIEGGGEVLASAFEARGIDEVRAFIAPRVVGGRGATTPVEGPGVERIADALALDEVRLERVGTDLLVRARVQREGAEP